MWGSLRMQLVEKGGHALPLQFGVTENWGTTANSLVLRFNLWCSPFGNPRRDHGLEWERNEVAVHEKVLEKVVGLGHLEIFVRSFVQCFGGASQLTVAGPPMLSMTMAISVLYFSIH